MLERLKILLENNVIKKESYDLIIEIDEKIFHELSLEDSNDKENMFWTHLAIAIDRALKDEQLDEISEEIVNEVESQEMIAKANERLAKIENMIDKKFNLAERTFILLHTCNVLKGEEND